MNIRPTTQDAYRLFHEGSIALAEAEFNGVRCDKKYCERMISNIERQIRSLQSSLNSTELGKAWTRRYGSNTSYTNDYQLRAVLLNDLKIESDKETKGGNKSVDAEVLSKLGRDDVNIFLKIKNLTKMSGTYLKNLINECQEDGLIHPFFHLSSYDEDKSGGAASYRSSSSDPNWQNQPYRHESDRRIVRRAIIPRENHRIVGRDYSGIEVRISACYHQDKNMIRYIEKGDDMHRDCASMCFKLPNEECTSKYGSIGKDVRFAGKNSFVFAQFYFQDPYNTAKGLWKSISDLNLRVPSDPDKSIFDHLKDKKISNFYSFKDHIIKVADSFWKEMFPDYGKWRLKWIEAYNKKGYFDMLTGFRVEGIYSQFQLANYPIQGPAFHCLLWSMIETNRMWKKNPDTRSKIIGQIHDELTTDEHEEEFWKNQETIPRIMSEDIRKEWKWIIVPLEVETEATGVNESWYYKRKVGDDASAH